MKHIDDIIGTPVENSYEFHESPEEFGFEWVTDENILEKSRWSILVDRVAKRRSDNTFWQFSWQVGATEYQEVDDDIYGIEVFPMVVEKTVYLTQKDLDRI